MKENKMIIYRVENSRGEGIYYGACSVKYKMQDENHPTPSKDCLLVKLVKINYPKKIKTNLFSPKEKWISSDFIQETFIFGFASIEQLKRWIYKGEWRYDLSHEGFRISVYECEEAYCGRTQAMINKKKKYELVSKMSLMEI